MKFETEHGIAHDKGSNMFSGMQAVFTVSLIVGGEQDQSDWKLTRSDL